MFKNYIKNIANKEITKRLDVFSIGKKFIPNRNFLDPKGQDASNFLEDYINGYNKQIKEGFYHVKRPIILESFKQLRLPNVTFYTTENTQVFSIKNDKYDISDLTINSSLVKDPVPEVSLIGIYGKDGRVSFSKMKNIRLIGSIYDSKGNIKEGGHTGIKWYIFNNEIHFTETTVLGEELNTILDFQSETPNSRHKINITGYRSKRLIITNSNRVDLEYLYNGAYTKLESEKDLPLVEINGKYCTIKTHFPDHNKRENERLGQKQYADQYKAVINGERCLSYDTNYDFGEFKGEIEHIHKS